MHQVRNLLTRTVGLITSQFVARKHIQPINPKLITSTMESFCGRTVKNDIYNSVHIDLAGLEKSEDNQDTNDQDKQQKLTTQFESTLQECLKRWVESGKRSVWFRVPLSLSHLIPILVEEKFEFHHAKPDYCMLIKWIKEDQEMTIPKYAHSMLGVGALVYNPTTKKVLLIQEKTSIVKIWKFPGGYAEPGEDISSTAIREVLEETGLKCRFHSLLNFRHRHGAAFGCSDFYFVCLLYPEDVADCTIKACEVEIDDCQWFDIQDAAKLLCGFNQYVFEHFLNQFICSPQQADSVNTTTVKGNTINSEVIDSKYGHIEIKERVYSLGPIKQFE